jgi:hypothetical protein
VPAHAYSSPGEMSALPACLGERKLTWPW